MDSVRFFPHDSNVTITVACIPSPRLHWSEPIHSRDCMGELAGCFGFFLAVKCLGVRQADCLGGFWSGAVFPWLRPLWRLRLRLGMSFSLMGSGNK